MKHLLLALAALSLVTATSAQVREAPQPGWAAPLVLTSGEGLQRLPLPLPVLLASRSPGYADVRLTSPQGEILPMAWAQAPVAMAPLRRTEALPLFEWPDRMESAATGLSPTGDQTHIRVDARGAVVEIHSSTQGTRPPSTAMGAARWLLDLSQAHQARERLERLQLDWHPMSNGLSMQVQVESSDDAAQWHAVTSAALLELAGAASDAVNLKHIDWPATAAPAPRYLRLSFDAPIALKNAEVLWTQSAQTAPLASALFEFTQETPQSATDAPAWTVDLGGRLPLSQIELIGHHPNTVSALRLERRDDPAHPWQAVTSFVAWRLQRQGAEQQSTAVSLPVRSARFWRLVGDARTSRPGDSTLQVRLAWVAPQIVFASGRTQGVELQVGFDRATDMAVPLPTLMPGYETGAEHHLPTASVGTLAARPVHQPTLMERLSSPTPTQKKQWLLWAVLGVATLGLGLMALRLSSDLKSRPAPPDTPD